FNFSTSCFETTWTCFFDPPEKALSFLAARFELLPIVNLVPDGRLESVPISLAVTAASAVPGLVPEKMSPDAEATDMSLSSRNTRLLLDFILVPLSNLTVELPLL